MSSAAKLRNRGIAVVGATALVMTSFGPAAFAYRDPGSPTASNQAGAASFGLTDTDPGEAGTQGATAVTPGGSGQAAAQMKFVLPSTWQTGDSIDFVISRGTDGATDPGTAAERVSYSSTPAVSISNTAYDEKTHVEDQNGPNTDPNSAGSVNGGELTAYTRTGPETPAKAPQFKTQVLSEGDNNYENVLRITFDNDSDPAAARAKFVGTIDAKFDVGTGVTGAIPVAAKGVDNGNAGDGGVLSFLGDSGTESRNVTYPAAVVPASLDVQNGSVVADGSNQNVGPLTVTAANGSTFNGPVTVGIDGATFTTDQVTANAYNAAGTLVSSGPALRTANSLSYAPAAADNVTRVVFTNPIVTAPETGQRLTYSLDAAGGLTPLDTPLGGAAAPTHQIDIEAPTSGSATQPVASELPDRIGGQDRYQTAVKIAERALGTNSADGLRGESDNVVIASGEGFADALSAGYLAATKNAQLILTRAGSLPQTDVEFLKNYGAKNVFVVGGNGSVSKTVEAQLKGLQSYDVQSTGMTTDANPTRVPDDQATGSDRKVVPLEAKLTVTRLAGGDRFETNRKVNEYAGATSINPIGSLVAEYGKPRAKTALVTNGMAPWDALAAGPLVGNNSPASASRYPLPVILTSGSALNANAKTQMQTLDVESAIFVGGAGVLPDSLMGEADNLGAYTSRLAGADRWGTAKAIADFALKDSAGSSTNRFPGLGFAATNPILANGGSMNGNTGTAQARGAWADALAAGPWAAASGRVIALTDSRSLPGTTRDMLTANAAKLVAPVVAVGLGDVISTETVQQANAALQK